MRKPYIAGNWKMNKNVSDALNLAVRLKYALVAVKDIDITVCPPYTALKSVREVVNNTNIKLGAQNMAWEESGAITGEVSPGMLKDVGCEVVILGHSERREFFSETDELVNRKIKLALEQGLEIIVCIGEKLDQREADKTFDVVGGQLAGALADLEPADMESITIAYEPVWAIGTGKNATPDQAQEVHSFIRGKLAERFDQGVADSVRIQYGGSVKPDNVDGLMAKADIDGALVGGASLDAESFGRIVRFKQE